MYRIKHSIEVDADKNGVYQGIKPGNYKELPAFITEKMMKKYIKSGIIEVDIPKKKENKEKK